MVVKRFVPYADVVRDGFDLDSCELKRIEGVEPSALGANRVGHREHLSFFHEYCCRDNETC